MIKAKLKECSECHKMTYLWKAKPKLCRQCALKISSSEPLSTDDSFTVKKPNKISPKRIKPVSDKKLLELKEYRKIRDEYLRANPICEFDGCNSRDVTLHHKSGRVGKLLTDKQYFCSLCIKHHSWVEVNPDEAKKLGLSLSRLSNNTNT